MLVLFCFILGYLTCSAGFLAGGFLSVFIKDMGKKTENFLLAVTAGLLLAFVCFEMLPQAFTQSLYFGITALIVGTIVAIALESAGSALVLGLAAHKLPEGFALGALLGVDLSAGLSLAAVIAIHCIPEAIALVLLLKRRGLGNGKVAAYLLTIGFPMAVGAGAGAIAGQIVPWFLTVSLGFAGGLMIYLSCSKILPEARSDSSVLLACIGAISGFIAGIFIILT